MLYYVYYVILCITYTGIAYIFPRGGGDATISVKKFSTWIPNRSSSVEVASTNITHHMRCHGFYIFDITYCLYVKS